jgi:RNA recognition motif. (a.k.a. RRM, RBD, or RNP domain)
VEGAFLLFKNKVMTNSTPSMITMTMDSRHSLLSDDKTVDNSTTAFDRRFVAVGVPRSLPIQNLYKYFSQFGEVKFCVVIPPSLQLNQLGDLHQSCLESLVIDDYNQYNSLVEVSITRGFLKIPKVQKLKKQSFVCLALSNPTKTSDDLIQTVKDRKLFVYGLKKSIKEDTLCQIFKVYGKVEYTRIICNLLDQRSKGFGFVVFKHPTSRLAALADGHMYFKDKLIRWVAFKTIVRDSNRPYQDCLDQSSNWIKSETSRLLSQESGTSTDILSYPPWRKKTEDPSQSQLSDSEWIPSHSPFLACKKYRFNMARMTGSSVCNAYKLRYGKPAYAVAEENKSQF